MPEACVIHSFRHSLRDRLRALQCPLHLIDQIGVGVPLVLDRLMVKGIG